MIYKIFTYIIVFTVSPIFVYASAHHTADLGTFAEWIGSKWVNTGVAVLISLGVLVFIWGAFQWLSSGANEEVREMGKHRMINGIIGIFIMISIWGLVNILINTIGFGYRTDASINPLIIAPEADYPI